MLSSLLLLLPLILALDVNEEILPASCDCRDWYGQCRAKNTKWTDDDTWNYECTDNRGQDAPLVSCSSDTPSRDVIPVGTNKTVGSLWHSCQADQQRVKYDSEPHCFVNGSVRHVGETFRDGRFQWLCLATGRWVVGCFFSNETVESVYLPIGETAFNGLIKHVCDRFEDYPGRVQYYAQVRDNAHVKHPTNKGINKNFPEPKEDILVGDVPRWLHETASSFIASDVSNGRVRYLPASRIPWPKHE